MARKKLTSLGLEQARPGKEFTDETGLRVHVRKTRTVFLARYRRPGDRRGAKVVLGFFDPNRPPDLEPTLGGPLTLSEARVAYSRVRDDLARGIDPGVKKQRAKRQQQAEAELNAATTFERVAREFVLRYGKARQHRRWRNQAGALGLVVNRDGSLRDEVRPGSLAERWRTRPIAQVTLRDVQIVCDGLIENGTPYAALSRWKVLRRLFTWGKSRGLIATSPLTDAEQPFRGTSRDRVLTEVELRALILACRRPESGLFGKLCLLLLLTGCRRDECRGMQRGEVNAQGTWTIPKERVKTKVQHVVHLSRQARELLADLPALRKLDGSPSTMMFDGGRHKPLGGMARHKKSLDKLMVEEFKVLGGNLEPWRLHDLRRTLATQCQKLGVRFEVVERMLNHRGVSRSGVASIYQRYDFAPDQARAWQAWADRLDLIAEGKMDDANVVPLRSVS